MCAFLRFNDVLKSRNFRELSFSFGIVALCQKRKFTETRLNRRFSLKADNPAKTKAELSKISRLQYIV